MADSSFVTIPLPDTAKNALSTAKDGQVVFLGVKLSRTETSAGAEFSIKK